MPILPSLFLLAATHLSAAERSPIGTWRTIDDETHKPRALVRIERQDDALSGRIVQLFRDPGEDPAPLCAPCAGERHNQPVLGMTILWNFHRQGDIWTDGEVLDPEEGKIYRANLRLRDEGTRLDVHGYIGVPLLGRSQVWERVTGP
jgi:uncharacterized protein (DUF2147 family)